MRNLENSDDDVVWDGEEEEKVVLLVEECEEFPDHNDGQKYRIIKMPDGKIWMAQNLNFATEKGSWCYDNDPANGEKYGRLYDWETAKKVCPAGWHLPSKEEWETLVSAVGGKETAGKKLKSKSDWLCGGTDDFWFSAQPGGIRLDGIFSNVGCLGYWWSATEDGKANAWSWLIRYISEGEGTGSNSEWVNKAGGLSVRYVKD